MRSDTPRPDATRRSDPPRPDAPRADTPRANANRPDPARSGTTRSGTTRSGANRPDTNRPGAARRYAAAPPLDELDQAIGHALQLDGRAPFARIAEVLEVSDQTVARRWTRLRTTRSMRVLGLTDPEALGETRWLVRVRTTPDAALPLAEALARRTDTSWVGLLAGGTEVSAVARATSRWSTEGGGEAMLMRELPRTPRVLDVEAYCQLRQFFGGEQGLLSKSGSLTPEQVAALTPPAPEPLEEPVELSGADRELLAVLARDGRAPVPELASATGWSASTVRRRMAELRATGVLYFDVDYGPRLFDQGLRAAIWLSLPPSELHAAGEAAAEHPEVAFACATTGPANMFLTVACRNTTALYAYLTGPLARLPAREVQVSPMVRSLKGPGPFLNRP